MATKILMAMTTWLTIRTRPKYFILLKPFVFFAIKSYRILAFVLLGPFVFEWAFAMPEYSVREGKQCIYCHVNAKGGPLNARGRYYGEHFNFDGFAAKKKHRRAKVSR